MSKRGKTKPGGSKLSRTKSVTIRLDPKLHYLAELAARKQRRTMSAFIEWAIDLSLGQVKLRDQPGLPPQGSPTLAEEGHDLWDLDEADRFAVLASRHPELLTHEEQALWKLIWECNYFWRGTTSNGTRSGVGTERELDLPRLRERWRDLKAVAASDKDPSILPSENGNEAVLIVGPPGEKSGYRY